MPEVLPFQTFPSQEPPGFRAHFAGLAGGVEVTLVNGPTSDASRVDFTRFFELNKLGWGYPSVIDLTDKCSHTQSWEINKDGTRSLVITFKSGNRPHLSGLTENGKPADIHESLRKHQEACAKFRYDNPSISGLPNTRSSNIDKILGGGLAIKTLRIDMKDGPEQSSVLSQGLQYIKTWLSGPDSMQTTDVACVNVASVIFEGDFVEPAQKSDTGDVRV